ncbi:Glutamate 5-kinase [Planctomycetales bacterium 10988]|nr:Glutamate 5-kinase [Planctomycetales bacterium 10988]
MSDSSEQVAELTTREKIKTTQTWVVKVGTRVLTRPDGRLNEEKIANLAWQIHEVMKTGRRVVLVSSGAVGAGMGQLGLTQRPTDVAHLQAVAAVGQAFLVQSYDQTFRHYDLHAAQILLTREDLEHRGRYLNVRNALLALFDLNAVPIVNENDSVSVEELQLTFGDNDRLAALVASLFRNCLLVILSDVEGLYDRDPRDPEAQAITEVPTITPATWDLVRDRFTGLSKGGMASKLKAAELATKVGEQVIIASGRKDDSLIRILAGEPVGTFFGPQPQMVTARKRWIAFSAPPRGKLMLDDGACQAVIQRGKSLLAIGIMSIEGNFKKGDVVSLLDRRGEEIARGLSNYEASELRLIRGLNSDQIESTLGHCPYIETIHRDHLVVLR